MELTLMSNAVSNASADADAGLAEGTAVLMGLVRESWRFAALRALITADVPRQLRDGPRSAEELAQAGGLHAPTLLRLLRNVATTGLLRTVAPGTYELTPAGRALLRGVGSQSARWSSVDEVYGSLADLSETVRTGVSPFLLRHGTMYDFLSAEPELSEIFDVFMELQSTPVAARVGELLAESGRLPAGSTLVDVGGGKGTFAAAILRANPGARGVVLDLERSAAVAQAYLAQAGVAERSEFVAGDFFKSVPADAEAYLLSQIVHNWDDERVTTILRGIRAGIRDDGQLLIVEAPLAEDDEPSFVKDLDIRMLTLQAGGERTLAEYESLLGAAGFRLADMTHIERGVYLLSAVPVAS
jgi:hypothetical protein